VLPEYANSPGDYGINAKDLFAGVLRGLGQVFLANNLVAGALVLVAIAVCPRITAAAAVIGSALGAAIALATGVPGCGTLRDCTINWQ
jgi:urea transporter